VYKKIEHSGISISVKLAVIVDRYINLRRHGNSGSRPYAF
jgi:hypothetical protein